MGEKLNGLPGWKFVSHKIAPDPTVNTLTIPGSGSVDALKDSRNLPHTTVTNTNTTQTSTSNDAISSEHSE